MRAVSSSCLPRSASAGGGEPALGGQLALVVARQGGEPGRPALQREADQQPDHLDVDQPGGVGVAGQRRPSSRWSSARCPSCSQIPRRVAGRASASSARPAGQLEGQGHQPVDQDADAPRPGQPPGHPAQGRARVGGVLQRPHGHHQVGRPLRAGHRLDVGLHQLQAVAQPPPGGGGHGWTGLDADHLVAGREVALGPPAHPAPDVDDPPARRQGHGALPGQVVVGPAEGHREVGVVVRRQAVEEGGGGPGHPMVRRPSRQRRSST